MRTIEQWIIEYRKWLNDVLIAEREAILRGIRQLTGEETEQRASGLSIQFAALNSVINERGLNGIPKSKFL